MAGITHPIRLLLLPLLLVCPAIADERPNFIFFLTEDISFDDIGPYGNTFVKTQHLDRIAVQGLVFDHAYLTASEDWVDLLKNRPTDRPFFAWFASNDAHRRWDTGDHLPHYDTVTIEVPPYLADGPQTRADLAAYFSEVSRTDTFSGKLIAEIERQGATPSRTSRGDSRGRQKCGADPSLRTHP